MLDSPTFTRPEPVLDAPKVPPRLDLYMPATPPLGLLAVFEFWVHVYRRRACFRRLFRPLLEETDQILADIGYHRKDIEWAMSLPLKADALKSLERCRQARYNQTGSSGPEALSWRPARKRQSR